MRFIIITITTRIVIISIIIIVISIIIMNASNGIRSINFIRCFFVAGWIYDVSESYQSSFLVSGAFCASCCCILFIVPLLKQNPNGKTSLESNKTNKLIDEQDLHRCPTDDPLTSWRPSIDTYCVPGWMNVYHEARETAL